MQKRRNCSKLSLNSSAFFGTLLLSSFLILQGCTGPRLHSDLKEDTKVLVRKWVLQTQGPFDVGDHGTEYSNPVMAENALIFGNRAKGLTSIYPGMAQSKWEFAVKGGVASEITEDHGNVYFGGSDGFFYSVNAETGHLNWKYEVRNPVVSKPTVVGSKVFFSTSEDVVYALDSGSGKWLWHYRRRTSTASKIYGASMPLVDGNEVLVGLSDGFLVALSLEEGQLKWERRLHFGSKFTDVNAHPVLENGIIYIPSYDGSLYALKRKDGEVLWKFDAGGSKDAYVEEEKIFLPSSDGNIYCLTKAGSKVLWKFTLDKGTPTRLIVTDRYVIVGSTYQFLYVLDKESGQGVYRFDVGYGSGFSGTPYYDASSRKIYILSGSGNLYAFEIRKPPHKIRPHGMKDAFDFD